MLGRMQSLDIRTHLGHRPVRLEPGKVVTEGGEFAADLILFMPGLTGPAWLEGSELPQSEGGFIAADERCRVRGMEHVYVRSEAHTSELQSLMRISYAVFCLKKKKTKQRTLVQH